MLDLTLIIARWPHDGWGCPHDECCTMHANYIGASGLNTMTCISHVPRPSPFYSCLPRSCAVDDVGPACFTSCRRFYYIRHPPDDVLDLICISARPVVVNVQRSACPGRALRPIRSRPSSSWTARRNQDLRLGHVTSRGLMPIGGWRSRDVPVFVGLLVSGFRELPVVVVEMY